MKPDAIQTAAISGSTRLSNWRRPGRFRQVAQICQTFAATSETAISGRASRSGMTMASTEIMTSGMPSPMAPFMSPPRNIPAIATASVNGSMDALSGSRVLHLVGAAGFEPATPTPPV